MTCCTSCSCNCLCGGPRVVAIDVGALVVDVVGLVLNVGLLVVPRVPMFMLAFGGENGTIGPFINRLFWLMLFMLLSGVSQPIPKLF